MSENKQDEKLRRAFSAANTHQPPEFASVWSAAEREYRKSRRRYAVFGSVAATAAVIAIAMGTMQGGSLQTADEFLIAESLLNSTQWSAPSDVLMPEHRFDIYREIPFLNESTDMQEGSLL